MLDVHIAKSFDETMQNVPVVSIDFDVHATFFNDRLGLIDSRPQLQRMSNYYSDCTFKGDEIPTLLEEVTTASNSLTPTSPHQVWLKQLADACQMAKASGNSLFAVCD